MKLISMLIFLFLTVFQIHADNGRLSPEQIKMLRTGIFEIVIPKIEDTKLKYKEKLPWHLVPFHKRNDKYHSIGTAFALGKNYFVSAAHVFSVHQKTIYKDNFYLRNEDGKIFTIDKILKYSNYRDVIVFSLKKPPTKKHIFQTNNQTLAGNSVFTGGNALGQGVVFRAGTISSYTDEHLSGKWKHIRYSAPASPGNSGGPLLNTKGEVIGIVTMKTKNENLNYALPIDELKKVSSRKSEFFINSMYEYESQKIWRYQWKFSTNLPIKLAIIMQESQKSLLALQFEYRDRFVKKYSSELFPNAKQMDIYRHSQTTDSLLGIIDNDANGVWGLYQNKNYSKYKITPNQKLYVAKNKHFYGKYQIFVEKPKKVSLKKFFKKPRIAFDIFVRSLKWYRDIGGAKIPILSYGDPEETTIYNDEYGRPWITARWDVKYSNRNFFIYCLTAPDGLACDVFLGKKSDATYLEQGYKMNLHRIMLSYNATMKQWHEFLQLPAKYIPKTLKEVKISHGNKFNYSIGTFKGSIANTKINEESEFGTWIKLDIKNKKQLAIDSFYIEPNRFENDYFWLGMRHAPLKDSSDHHKNTWKKQINHQAPYHNKIYKDGKKNVIKKVLAKKGTSQKSILIATCSFGRFVSKKTLKSQCSSFKNGIK